ncbi:GOLPH3/VPS74 family protein [Streptomyces phaeochromogenes]
MQNKTLIVEDLMLLLMDDKSGAIVGAGTLYYTLGGAVLVELGLDGHITVDENDKGLNGLKVHAVSGEPLSDPVLHTAHEKVAERVRGVQTLLIEIGTGLRETLLDRLVERGMLRRESKRTLGVFRSTSTTAADTQHKVERDIFSDWEAPPPADVIRSAIALAAQGKPLGYDRELTSRLRRIRHTTPATRAVEATLTQDSPEPDAEELRLTLRLALGVHASELNDPLQFARALHRLSSHSQAGDSALLALRRTCWDLLFPQMVQDDEARRREARTIFDAIATPHEHTRFASYTASQSFWSKQRQRLRQQFRRG